MSVSKWRYTEECNGRPCPGDCDYCSFEPGDLISRADAIEAVKDTILKRFNLADWYEEMLNCGVEIEDRIKALPSADAKPTVVRCKMMIPYGDFREWAKRIREDNPNVIVIPFDAEVASADAVPQLKQTDTLIIADALRYLAQDTERHLTDRTRADALRQQFLKYGASMCKGGDDE